MLHFLFYHLEILYYKFLAILICSVPFGSWKISLLDYVNRRFPSAE